MTRIAEGYKEKTVVVAKSETVQASTAEDEETRDSFSDDEDDEFMREFRAKRLNGDEMTLCSA